MKHRERGRARKVSTLASVTFLFLSTAHAQTVQSYDGADRLIQTQQGNTTTQFYYDAVGDLVRQCVTVSGQSATCTDFVVDDLASNDPTIVGEISASGTLLRATGPVGFGMQRNLSTSTVAYGITDHEGSVRALADSTGAIVGQAAYDAYGAPVALLGTASLVGFAGERSSPDGTIYLRSRQYSPSLGRFLQRDAYAGDFARSSSLNRYPYVEGNPVNFVDPSGRYGEPLGFGTGLATYTGEATAAGVGVAVAAGAAAFAGTGFLCAVTEACGEDATDFWQDIYGMRDKRGVPNPSPKACRQNLPPGSYAPGVPFPFPLPVTAGDGGSGDDPPWKKRRKEPNCDDETYKRLKKAVDLYKSTALTPTNCNMARAEYELAERALNARKRITDICFGGELNDHEPAFEQARQRIRNAIKDLNKFCRGGSLVQ